MTSPPAPVFDPARAYELDARVSLRPEPFGALAYHRGTRRLTFVRDRPLVALLEDLRSHDSVDAALAASPIDPSRWPALLGALARLSDTQVIRGR